MASIVAEGALKANRAAMAGTHSTVARSTTVTDAIHHKAALRARGTPPDVAHERFTWISARLLSTSTVKASARATSSEPEPSRAS